MAEFHRRIAYVEASYRFGREVERKMGSFNESLARMTRAFGPRARRAAVRRLHPELELAVRMKWLARFPDAHRAPTPDDIHDICSDILRELAPIRGRPNDVVL
jgi:hypothetical protein